MPGRFPEGKIAINRGLLLYLNNEAELAAVLGHEIVHAAAAHGALRYSREAIFQGALGIGQSFLGPVTSLASTGVAAFQARHSRRHELDSDAYGMDYMVLAGYDPFGAVDLQRTFVKLSEGRQQDFVSGLFASHPPSQERVNANLAKARTLPQGDLGEARFKQKMAGLLKDKPAYERYEKGLAAAEDKNWSLALKESDAAIKLQAREGLFWELRGQSLEQLKRNREALTAYTRAIENNPTFFRHWLFRGNVKIALGDRDGARSDLQRSLQILPTQQAQQLLASIGG